MVTITGSVQATLQRLRGSTSRLRVRVSPAGASTFDLVKVDGQWRITNPPPYRMLNQDEFPLYYKAQDLYFFDPSPASRARCSSRTRCSCRWARRRRSCVDSLVNALTQPPQTSWLANGAVRAFPARHQVLDVPVG